MLISTSACRPAPNREMVPFRAKDFFVERQVPASYLDDAVDAGIIRQSEEFVVGEIVLVAVETKPAPKFRARRSSPRPLTEA